MRIRDFLNFQPISKKSLVILCSLMVTVSSFAFLIHVRVEQALLGYAIAEHEDELLELEERLKQLKLEIAVRKRPERIQERASEWFKMRYSHE